MYKSEREKDSMMGSLMEMFAWLSKDEIRKLCEANCWSLECCIDKLVNCDNRDNPPMLSYNEVAAASSHIPQPVEMPMIPVKAPRPNPINTYTPEFYEICENIQKGYLVLVLMRGAPGSGKSFLATKLVELSGLLKDGFTKSDFVYSTDDFFYDCDGNYNFRPDQLDTAHTINHHKIRTKAMQGWSPIIIDNTNMQLWEMKPYVQIAVEYGYLIRILEPNTPWKHSSYKLAARNSHNVPRQTIQRVLDKYEPATIDMLLKMLTSTQYRVPLPQKRQFPVIDFVPSKPKNLPQKDTNPIIETETLNPLVKSPPKEQRERTKAKVTTITNKETNENTWQKFEEEASGFWFGYENYTNIETIPQSSQDPINNPTVSNPIINTNQPEKKEDNGKNLLDILKENFVPLEPEKSEQQSENKFIPHNVGCPNENTSFSILRQVYPNQEISSLWDLFVKCNGNIDWAADVLLKEEDSFSMNNESDSLHITNNFENICSCMQSEVNAPTIMACETTMETETSTSRNTAVKPQRIRSGRTPKHQLYKKQENLDIKQQIENKFIFSEEQYPEGVRKFREKINSININNSTINNHSTSLYENINLNDNKLPGVSVGVQKDFIDEDNDENEEILELSLGVELVGQLQQMFKNEYYLGEKVNDTLNTNIFIPKSLAKQLFMLWMESAYNQMEEENQRMVREDEYFARLLKNPQYEHCMESPNNVHELLDKARIDIETYEANIELQQNDNYNEDNQQNLATKLTFLKLCEQFPYIPQDTIFDVFATHNKDYTQSLNALNSTNSNLEKHSKDISEEDSSNIIPKDEEMPLSSATATTSAKKDENKDKSLDYGIKRVNSRKTMTPEEAKHIALREFEDSRNLAAHHCQLKAECYEKAKDAIQKGNGSVAAYYSQIANLHKSKIDMFNNRAANCIMEVHKHTQNNPDLLDLHYLHVIEAVGCLDIFLDQHITTLRVNGKSYKHLFVITGRGLHSIGGVSSIKNRVKQRLRERFLRWTEVNPGLLKIKLFHSSHYTTDI